jgi:hypothetical protein
MTNSIMKDYNSLTFLYFQSIIGLLIIILFFGGCSNSSEDNERVSSEQTETKSNISNMLYKLYIVKTIGPANESRGIELFQEFNKIYKENDVKVIGVWLNSDDPNEVYFMTAFDDTAHYNSFTESMKDNQRYQEMSQEMESERESIKAVNLKMAVSL